MKLLKKLLVIIMPILVLAVLASPVFARGGVFEITPHQEAVQSLPILNTDESAAGNVSASGYIDFYVLGPNGTVLLCYNHTEFAEFKFYPDVKGVCTIHMADNYESGNVTVNLIYGINFVVVCEATIDFTMSTATTAQTASITITSEPSYWSEILDFIKNNISAIFTALLGALGSIVAWLKKLPYRIWYWRKYRKNRTPSDVLNSPN